MITQYYKKRAEEYEAIYYRYDPIRQQEQEDIKLQIQQILQTRDVLEIASGTGYWTQFLSQTANSIMATDLIKEVLKIAKKKEYSCPVTFKIKDAYNLRLQDQSFTGGLANFWFSHIPHQDITRFLTEFHRVMKPGSKIFLADNVFVEGIGGKLISPKNDKNTYKERFLNDGSKTLVLKNYYTKKELLDIFRVYDPTINENNIYYGKCFWAIHYQLN